jgi:hypothetical protein
MRKSNTPISGIFEQFTSHEILELVLKEEITVILEECPLTKFQQGFSKLHLLTEDALNWLQQIKNI